MRRWVLLLGVVVVPLLSGTAAASPSKDIVNGTIRAGDQTVTMSAQTLSASTSSAKGSWDCACNLTGTILNYSGTVNTLLVDGQLATACGTITSSDDPSAVGDEFQQYVNDTGNGSPHGSGDTSESFIFPPGTPCIPPELYQAFGFGVLNTSGNWYVFDADAP
jgi:hypothetical protein